MDWQHHYAARMQRVQTSDIRERMKLLGNRELIQLAGGVPDPNIFPFETIREVTSKILCDQKLARTALQYAPSEGYGPLREWVAKHMQGIGAACEAENILVTNGSQQGLDLISKLLLNAGDTVMLEAPTFIGALRAFELYEPVYIALPELTGETDNSAQHGAKLCYVVPDFNNPTGNSMGDSEREALLDFADRSKMPIVEDGCYERLYYDDTPQVSLLSRSIKRRGTIENANVLHLGTFSKTMAPSLRIGWVVGPADVIRKLTLLKQASDLSTGTLNQMIVLQAAELNFDTTIAHARDLYRQRRDVMLAALETSMPEGVQWTRPKGGLYIWLTLPALLDGDDIAMYALTEKSVSAISGTMFYALEQQKNTLRLSFSLAPEKDIREGVRRLAEVIEDRGY